MLSGTPFIVVPLPHLTRAIAIMLGGRAIVREMIRGAPNGSRRLRRLADLEVVRGFLTAIAHDFILNDLTLIERAQSRTLDS